MEKFDPFNYPEGVPPRRGGYGIRHFDCEAKVGFGYGGYPNCGLVNLYAKLGLHRYNLLEGTNIQLHSLKGFNMSLNGGASCYFITLAACFPASGSQPIFQVQVDEECLGMLDLTCPISRPLGTESSKPFLRPHCKPVSSIYNGSLPDWPSSDIAFSDTKRFYLVKESELQYNDWISLYVQLALCTAHRKIKASDLAKFELEIVQVAIETLDDLELPKLDSKNAVVYIAYKDLAKARIGEPCDRKAIVRRIFNQTTGTLRLRGKYWSDEAFISNKPSRKKSAMFRHRLGVYRIWRLSNLRFRRAYNGRGLRSWCSRLII